MPLPPNERSLRCLILACGNTLRGDDGVGPWLAAWAEERFRADRDVKVVSRQQWTPELAVEVASAQTVVFIDCSIDAAAGAVAVRPVSPSEPPAASHHLGAPELLALARDLYQRMPARALILTVGAGTLELGEEFSDAVKAALPNACAQLESKVLRVLA